MDIINGEVGINNASIDYMLIVILKILPYMIKYPQILNTYRQYPHHQLYY